jgi:hypothetical protein
MKTHKTLRRYEAWARKRYDATGIGLYGLAYAGAELGLGFLGRRARREIEILFRSAYAGAFEQLAWSAYRERLRDRDAVRFASKKRRASAETVSAQGPRLVPTSEVLASALLAIATEAK